MTQRIDVDPNPMIAGQTVTICYTFPGAVMESVTLEVLWTPTSLDSVNCGPLTPDDHCCTLTVPENATSYVIKDLDGDSEDRGGAVSGGG